MTDPEPAPGLPVVSRLRAVAATVFIIGALVAAISIMLADDPTATAIGVLVGFISVGIFAFLAAFLSARQLERNSPRVVSAPPARTDRDARVSGVRVGALNATGGLVAGGGALLLLEESDLSVLAPVIAGLASSPTRTAGQCGATKTITR